MVKDNDKGKEKDNFKEKYKDKGKGKDKDKGPMLKNFSAAQLTLRFEGLMLILLFFDSHASGKILCFFVIFHEDIFVIFREDICCPLVIRLSAAGTLMTLHHLLLRVGSWFVSVPTQAVLSSQ